jgi:hypothetical protein
MSETLDANQDNNAGKRPGFLTVLCILSFIAAGFSIIGNILMGLVRGAVDTIAGGSTKFSDAMNEAGASSAETTEAMATVSSALSWPFIIISMVLTLVGLFGVIKMWKLNKQGFYIYTGTAIAGIILPLIFGIPFSTFGTLITVAFIAMYGANLKAMK